MIRNKEVPGFKSSFLRIERLRCLSISAAKAQIRAVVRLSETPNNPILIPRG